MAILNFRAWDSEHKRFIKMNDTIPNIDLDHVMQMTGMIDQNKQDIYEGDICRGMINIACVKKEMVGQVVYNASNGRFELKDDKSSIPLHIATGLKVLGNIHENLNLLNEG